MLSTHGKGGALQCPPQSLFWQDLPGLGMFRLGRRVGPTQLSQLSGFVLFSQLLWEDVWAAGMGGLCCLHVKPDLAQGLPCCFSWEEQDLWLLCWDLDARRAPQAPASSQ